jgi:S1-C subfamily serine protease
MSESPANKFITFIVIVAAPFAMGAFFMAWSPSQQYQLTDPKYDGFVAPRSISDTVKHTARSTVTVYCEISEDLSIGSAWAISLDERKYQKYPFVLVTNHHVVEDCIGREKYLTVARQYQKEIPAKIVTLDKKNDLAVIVADLRIPTLKLANYPPMPGYWTMLVGSADGYEGSVAFGSVLNTTATQVLITTNASQGNSGGPVIDNEGRVIGTLTSGAGENQYNIAMSLDAMCSKILTCDGEYFWKFD